MEQNIQYDNEIATAETSASMDAASNTGEGYLIAQAIRSEFSGPLPHPEILAKYEDILPGAATRILEMAEEQAIEGLWKKTVWILPGEMHYLALFLVL